MPADSLSERAHGFEIGPWQENDEFFAPEAPDDVVRASAAAHGPCESGEHLIANEVAVRVVDELELVEVEQGYAEGSALETAGDDRVLGGVHGTATAEQTGQLIVPGEVVQR